VTPLPAPLDDHIDPETFELWLGDPDSDQAALPLVARSRPAAPEPPVHPGLGAPEPRRVDAGGNSRVTLGGVDASPRSRPQTTSPPRPSASSRPGGMRASTGGKLDPHDIAVDGHGIVRATRRRELDRAPDPADASGLEQRIRATRSGLPILRAGCSARTRSRRDTSRAPEQMALQEDGVGNTIVWYTERPRTRSARCGSRLTAPCLARSTSRRLQPPQRSRPATTARSGSRRTTTGSAGSPGPGPFEVAGAQIAQYAIPSAPPVAARAASARHRPTAAVDELGRGSARRRTRVLGY
jgi:hypothetical protein